MAPDLRRKVDAARVARLAREAEAKKQVDAQVSLDSSSFVYPKILLLFLKYVFSFPLDLIETIKPIPG